MPEVRELFNGYPHTLGRSVYGLLRQVDTSLRLALVCVRLISGKIEISNTFLYQFTQENHLPDDDYEVM